MAGYSQYNHGLLADSDSHAGSNRPWFKAALLGGSPLLLFAIVATLSPAPTVRQAGADGATSLVGLPSPMTAPTRQMGSPMLRSGVMPGLAQGGAYGMSTRVQAVQQKLQNYGIGSTPLENLALTALDVNARGNSMSRDVSLQARSVRAAQAELASGWSLVEDETKNRLRRVLGQVEGKAKESLLAGVSAPLNYFDPLGYSTEAGQTGGKLLFYREVEIKHGRVAMLASLGILVQEQFHPLFGGNIDVPSYIAFQQTPLENFWPAVVTAIAIPEMFSIFGFQNPFEEGNQWWAMKTDHVPGDVGFDPLGLKPTDPKEFKTMQTKEINNGRLAMMASAGMIAQEIATDSKLFGGMGGAWGN